jgi:putative chitinase
MKEGIITEVEITMPCAADPDVGFRGACWFWKTNGLNELADAGNFDATTRRINGGYNREADRDAHYQRALQVLGAGSALRSVK